MVVVNPDGTGEEPPPPMAMLPSSGTSTPVTQGGDQGWTAKLIQNRPIPQRGCTPNHTALKGRVALARSRSTRRAISGFSFHRGATHAIESAEVTS